MVELWSGRIADLCNLLVRRNVVRGQGIDKNELPLNTLYNGDMEGKWQNTKEGEQYTPNQNQGNDPAPLYNSENINVTFH